MGRTKPSSHVAELSGTPLSAAQGICVKCSLLDESYSQFASVQIHSLAGSSGKMKAKDTPAKTIVLSDGSEDESDKPLGSTLQTDDSGASPEVLHVNAQSDPRFFPTNMNDVIVDQIFERHLGSCAIQMRCTTMRGHYVLSVALEMRKEAVPAMQVAVLSQRSQPDRRARPKKSLAPIFEDSEEENGGGEEEDSRDLDFD